jgi:UDP-2,3-diacylglucosamine hydrolase
MVTKTALGKPSVRGSPGDLTLIVPAYFASDIHLRVDQPERGERFARWVRRLQPDDPLVLAGDLCDFWFSARQRTDQPIRCPGLRALADFVSRGGSLTILVGNHDAWLGPFYQETLGARWVPEPLELTSHGRRLRLVHGHLLGGRSRWKGWMEGKTFLKGYGALPHAAAWGLQAVLETFNEIRLEASHQRLIAGYRRHVDALANPPDLFITGHVHMTYEEVRPNGTRLIILGNWHGRSSYLRVDDREATLVIEPE